MIPNKKENKTAIIRNWIERKREVANKTRGLYFDKEIN